MSPGCDSLRLALIILITSTGALPLFTESVQSDQTKPTISFAVNSLFGDGAVVQRGVALPVYGTAPDGDQVSVYICGQTVSTTAADGVWQVSLKPLAPGGPYPLRVRDGSTLTVANVLVGDVWVASGQSNMERQLGPRPPQPDIDNWQQEVAKANYPNIHEYYVPEVASLTPRTDVGSQWTTCSPTTAKDYTAVGYFFARDLYLHTKVPIGLIFSAWGGTNAESWVSPTSLKTMSDFTSAVNVIQTAVATSDSAYEKEVDDFFSAHDPGSAGNSNWAAPDIDVSTWQIASGTAYYDQAAYIGVIWTRREIDIPASWAGKNATLTMGGVDDNDTTFVNGVEVGATDGRNAQRHYTVPAGLLRTGRNVIAVRIVNISGSGGISADPTKFNLATDESTPQTIPLADAWVYKFGASMNELAGMPGGRLPAGPNVPTALYSGMISPLIKFPIKGVVWYQGENNNGRAEQYQSLLPLLISDWRSAWSEGSFPFLIVQIAPYRDMTAEIREAQLLTVKKTPNTALIVTTDIGDPDNIHPPHKAPVGARLALAAQALAYGEKVEYSGPIYAGMKVDGSQIVLLFTHVGRGLVAKDAPLKGFTIAGLDGNFVPADARIDGATVCVASPSVSNPVAARYGWANVPDVNLYNADGLPASPFRTDDGPPTTRADGSHSKQFANWYQECSDRVAAVQGKPVDIIFIGDSITQNWVEPSTPGWPLVGSTVWAKYFANRNVLDFGVGADGTENILWRLSSMNVQTLHPKVAVILAGINDSGYSAQDIAAGVEAVIAKTKALYPGIKVISVSILPNGRAMDKTTVVNQILLKDADNKSVYYLDLVSKMPPVGNGWQGIGFDKVHVTPEGYEIWASTMEPLLDKLLDGRK